MKISYNWLKNYVDFNLTPKDLGEVLTGVGLEVEDIQLYETIPGGLDGVVIGEVKSCGKHPGADKLWVTQVNVGGGNLLQIVCGAPNVATGQKVAVALIGSTIYPLSGEKMVIKKAKIRGVESAGMICAEDELGLGASHDGIMVLDSSAVPGGKAADYFKVEKDFVIDIGLTPNRSDAYSHIGVARDVVAALNVAYQSKVSLHKPDISAFEKLASPSITNPAIEVRDTEACPRYSGLTIRNVEVHESPGWLKARLKAIGLRPINNVVDCTNYVLHEYGQPLHAFDADKIKGGKVIIGKSVAGTAFKTLEGKEINLSDEDLVIADISGPMCLAGVMGGAESGVSAATKNIFLESAYFSPVGILKTSARHNLRTDAAMHFEKGCDPNIAVEALKRAALLIKETGGGEISHQINDIYQYPIEGWRFPVSFNRMMKLAGFVIDKETVKQILKYLEIAIEKEESDTWQLFVPAFKTDVKREADIVEEIIRIYGYNSFALPTAVRSSLSYSPKINSQKIENAVAELLSGAGFNEIITNSVVQSKWEGDEQLLAGQVKLLNSQSAELDALRTSMLYSGLEVIAYNQNRKAPNHRLFEFGTTYHKMDGKYKEKKHLSLFLTGNTGEKNWLDNGSPYNFYHLKSFVHNALRRLGHSNFQSEISERLPFNFSLSLKNEEAEIALLGSIDKSVLSKADVKSEVFYAGLNWDYLLEKSQFVQTSFTELPKFPSVKRDLALTIDQLVQFSAIEKIAKAETKNLLQEISLFDVYRGENIGPGKKSYAISFLFRHPDKTLTDPEIEKLMSRLMSKYESDLGAVIRKG